MNFSKLIKISSLFLAFILLEGCYTTTAQIPYWQHYNTCANSFSDIRQISECGKRNRTNYLAQTGMTNASSSQDGHMYVQFMDSLAGQVDDGKLTNNEAKMVWVQRTQELINGYRQAAAQAATANALQQQNNRALQNKGMEMITGGCTLGVNC